MDIPPLKLEIYSPNLEEIDMFLVSQFGDKESRISQSLKPDVQEIGNIFFGSKNHVNNKTALPFGMFCYLVNTILSLREEPILNTFFVRSIIRKNSNLSYLKLTTLRKNGSCFHIIRCPPLQGWYFDSAGYPLFLDPVLKIYIPYPQFKNLPEFLKKETQIFLSFNSHFKPAWSEEYFAPLKNKHK